MDQSKQRWQLIIGLLFGLGLVWFSSRGLDFGQLWSHLKGADYWWVLPAFIGRTITFSVRSWRWGFLLSTDKKLPPLRLFPAIAIGYMANNLLPFRLGEIVRGYVLRLQEGIPMSTGLVTIAVERVFDGVLVLLMVLIGLLFAPMPAQFRPFVTLGTIGFSAALIILILLARSPDTILHWSDRLIPQRWHKQFFPIMQQLQNGLSGLRSWRQIATLVGSSIIIWFLETGKFWFVAQAFEIDVPYTYLILIIGIVNLVSTLPGPPGFVGTFDAPIVGMLTLYGIGQDVAWAYTLVLHLVVWLVSIVLGLFFTLRLGLGWSELAKMPAFKAGDE